jgi:predicted nucleic acid-binding protein
MSAPEFLDSNVLVYAHDDGDPRKQEIAQGLIRRALLGEMVVSTQTLAEFSATLLQRFSTSYSSDEVLALLDALSPIRLVVPDAGIVRRAVEAHQIYGVHFYDGMIVAAAERGGCERIWSEDLNAGQKYFRVEVRNPFAK